MKNKKTIKKNNKIKNLKLNTPQTNQAPKWQYFIPPIILSILTILFYAPSMRYAFQFDDIANITKHFQIRHHTLSKLFFSSTRWISFWLNSIHYKIGKFDPFSYRIGNLIVHITSGILIFFILFIALRNLKKKNFFNQNNFSIALLTSLIFLLHPVQTQTVSYVIQGQLEGLAALFIFGMTLLFLKASNEKNNTRRYVFITFLFLTATLSCGTKEIAIISPCLLLLVDWFFVAQGDMHSLKKRLYIHIPLFLIVLTIYLYFLKPSFFTEILGLQRLAKNNIGNVITQNPTSTITPWVFFRSQFKVILHYLWIFIWPFGISVEYDWVLSESILSVDSFFPLVALIAIGLTILKLLKNNRSNLISFGALWFFVAIAPRSSIIPSPELLVDYKTYTASFGWLFLLSSGIIFLYQYAKKQIDHTPKLFSKPQYTTTILIFLLAIPLGFATTQRNTVWRSGLEFWGNILKNAPKKARAHNNYGVELSQNKHDFVGSIPYFKKAISMDSNYSDPWNNLAVAYANTGKIDDAIHSLKQSLKIYPYYPEGYNNLASFFIQKKDLKEAERLLNIALKLRPHYGKAYFNLGRIQFEKGEKEEAWKSFKKCCTECDFDNVPYGFATYGRVSILLKKYDDAIFAYQKALSFAPNYPEAAFNLANSYYMNQQYDNAIKIYQQIVVKNQTDFKAWYNLGEAHTAQKNYTDALVCYKNSKPLERQIPLINIRIAHCLEIIGKPKEAKKILNNFISIDNKNNNQLAQFQIKARQIISQLNQKYNFT